MEERGAGPLEAPEEDESRAALELQAPAALGLVGVDRVEEVDGLVVVGAEGQRLQRLLGHLRVAEVQVVVELGRLAYRET